MYKPGLPDFLRNRLGSTVKSNTRRTEGSKVRSANKKLRDLNPVEYKKQRNKRLSHTFKTAGVDAIKYQIAGTATQKLANKASEHMKKRDDRLDKKKSDSFSKNFLEDRLNEIIGAVGLKAAAKIGASAMAFEGGTKLVSAGVKKATGGNKPENNSVTSSYRDPGLHKYISEGKVKALSKFVKGIGKEVVVSSGIMAGAGLLKRGLDRKDARETEENKRTNAGRAIAKDKLSRQIVSDVNEGLGTAVAKHGKSILSKAGKVVKNHWKGAAFTVGLTAGPDLISHSMKRSNQKEKNMDDERKAHQNVTQALRNKRMESMNEAEKSKKKKQKKQSGMSDAKASARLACLRTMFGPMPQVASKNPHHKRGIKLGAESTKTKVTAESVINIRSKEIKEMLDSQGVSTFGAVPGNNSLPGIMARTGNPKSRNAGMAVMAQNKVSALGRNNRASS